MLLQFGTEGRIYDVLVQETHSMLSETACYLIGASHRRDLFSGLDLIPTISDSDVVYRHPTFSVDLFNICALEQQDPEDQLPFPYYRWVYHSQIGEGKDWRIIMDYKTNQDALSLTEVD
jgi:hypothetical protein